MPIVDEPLIAVDTSVAVPLLVQTHSAHDDVVRWWRGRPVVLSRQSLVETYSVLTRLPGDIRLSPDDAATLLSRRFGPPLTLEPIDAARILRLLAQLNLAGGSTYDALVALAAARNNCTLATRDARAQATYATVGVKIEIVN